MPRVSSKHHVTLPVEALAGAGFVAGDEVSIEAVGPDTIVVRRARRDPEAAFGVFDGLYESGYLATFDERVRRSLPAAGVPLAAGVP